MRDKTITNKRIQKQILFLNLNQLPAQLTLARKRKIIMNQLMERNL